ncbi:hypothetical protein [Enterococcus canintestini]|uniref:hypothetical protein n=1 Tax=Enterococcus canintestini TaxID=317010 RepID=UPI00288F61D1|nr:hypothetical protein [Enterococcus canintestini]MDT2740338.1 hypothetical protein [Enterococcus canintestini]
MNRYLISALESRKNTAASKAKEDIVYFLSDNGYENLEYRLPESRLKRLLFSKNELRKLLRNIQDGDTVVFQYPAYSSIVENHILNYLEKRKLKKVIIIHDLESLRFYKNDLQKIQKEIQFLNSFEVVISHNQHMTEWLRKNGVSSQIINLELFDYEAGDTEISIPKFEYPLIVAGNLEKSRYLEKLIINKNVSAFGINPSQDYPKSISYKGAYSPEELIEQLNGSFGIVWDGDSVTECTGILGEYLKYNNPHKTSLYLSLGVPVIIWKKAALSEFITANGIGFAVDRLDEIDGILDNMSEKEYNLMLSRTTKISEKIKNGYFIKTALNSIR